ncbi:SDR family oxidoreductase [Pararhizobium haloflavum]|uniref:SDR family oxidoreductase n=1 Tax=Pararhizobium haloflavum TaxID=2037914 RepID=UPI000C18B4C4|nr:SDR family oxidoreductase [Pararhizobium haloflavum]
MDLKIAGKRALVLASTRGLGRGIAEKLAEEGAEVLLCGRSTDRLEEAVKAIRDKGGKADFVTADLADPGIVDLLADNVDQKLGGVDILVNNTGGPPPGSMTDASMEVLSKQFDMMVLRVMAITARFLPGMKERGWGRVLTVASSGVIQPIPNLGLSNALRSALVGWSKSMANENAADGVTFNLLLPGRIDTERVEELDCANSKRTGKSIEDVREAARQTIPAGRYGKVEEFASVAAFLVSDPASYVTGGLIRCDGGAIKSV